MKEIIFFINIKKMIYKTKMINVFWVVFLLILNNFSSYSQKQLDESFKKIASKSYDIEYQVPKSYFGIVVEGSGSYDPRAGYLQSSLMYSIKSRKHSIVVAFAIVSTKPDNTPRGIRIKEVFGDQNKISKVVLANQADTTLSKVRYIDSLQLKKVNADRGAIYNIRINNKYMAVYGRCKKIELYKDDVGRAEILFFYNKGDDILVDEEINKTWGMLKFKP